MSYYFRIKKLNNLETVKVQPEGVAQHLLYFCQFQSSVAYESFA